MVRGNLPELTSLEILVPAENAHRLLFLKFCSNVHRNERNVFDKRCNGLVGQYCSGIVRVGSVRWVVFIEGKLA